MGLDSGGEGRWHSPVLSLPGSYHAGFCVSDQGPDPCCYLQIIMIFIGLITHWILMALDWFLNVSQYESYQLWHGGERERERERKQGLPVERHAGGTGCREAGRRESKRQGGVWRAHMAERELESGKKPGGSRNRGGEKTRKEGWWGTETEAGSGGCKVWGEGRGKASMQRRKNETGWVATTGKKCSGGDRVKDDGWRS